MNKKLIKTIAIITCGLGISSSIPFMSTSCGSSGEQPVPEDNFTLDYSWDGDGDDIYAYANENGVLNLSISNSYTGPEKVVYSIIDDPTNGKFTINSTTGKISYNNIAKNKYRITVKGELENDDKKFATINLDIDIRNRVYFVFLTYDDKQMVSTWNNVADNKLDSQKFSYRIEQVNSLNDSSVSNTPYEWSIVNKNSAAQQCNVRWDTNLNTVVWDQNKVSGGTQLSFQVKLSVTNSAEEASDEVSFVISIFENILPSNIFSYIVKSDKKITITGFDVDFSDAEIYDKFRKCDTIQIPESFLVDGQVCYVDFVTTRAFVTGDQTIIPDYIKNCSFTDSNKVTNVTIGEEAFEYSKIKSVYISNNVSLINRNAFAYCKLENVEVSDQNNSYAIAENIGDWRHDSKFFGNMIVQISDTGDSSESKYFKGNNCAGCLVCGYIYFGNNIPQIEANAFKHCYGILGIYLENQTSQIGDNAFMDCTNLNEIIWSGLTAIPTKLGSGIFANVARTGKLDLINNDESKLSERDLITYLKNNDDLPSEWEGMDKVIPYDNTSLNSSTSFFKFESVNILGVDGYSVSISDYAKNNQSVFEEYNTVVIPSYFNGKPVLSVAERGFVKPDAGCGNIGTALPTTIRHIKFADDSQICEIGSYSFQNCYTYELEFPSSLEKIGSSAFAWSNGYEVLDFSNNQDLLIRNHAFEGTEFKELYLPASINIQYSCFVSCQNLSLIQWTGLSEDPLIPNEQIFGGMLNSGVIKSVNNTNYNSTKLKDFLISCDNTLLESWTAID